MENNDPVFERAQADLLSAENALRTAQETVTRLRQFIEIYQRYTSKPTTKAGNILQQVPGFVTDENVRAGKQTEFLALQILKEKGVPLTTSEMLAEFRRRGVEVGGQEPVNTLHARLNRSSSLTHKRVVGWSIAETEAPAKDGGG